MLELETVVQDHLVGYHVNMTNEKVISERKLLYHVLPQVIEA